MHDICGSHSALAETGSHSSDSTPGAVQSAEIPKRIRHQPRAIRAADDPASAEAARADRVAGYRDGATKLAGRQEETVARGGVFSLPVHNRISLRIADPIERSVQQERKRRTVKIRV